MEQRGKIRNIDNARQINDFSGLRYGKITPTDIDGLMEFGNKVFIFIELKFRDTPMPFGQQLAIERIVDNLENSGKISVAILATHNASALIDIDVANYRVLKKRMFKKWHNQINPITLKQAIDAILKKYAPEFLV